jgi:hypothetical protein
MVIILLAHVAETPAGNSLTPETPSFEIPVAPVVLCVMFVKAVFIQSVGVDDAAPAVLFAVTVIVPVAFKLPQLPVKGML